MEQTKKVLEFTTEEKSLIWKQFVEPAKGTAEDAHQFVLICEQFGLNPLLGDIVFQRFETKKGPQVNFITTRDGLLRVAMRSSDYVGSPIGAVVREGDQFAMDPVNATVSHSFGTKRGKILGAWARMEHRRFKPAIVFIDFEEYYKANAYSQGGRSPVWDSLPSVMVSKVAEAFVIRRQFPLGGLYAAEELGMDSLSQDEAVQQEEQVTLQQPEQKSTPKITVTEPIREKQKPNEATKEAKKPENVVPEPVTEPVQERSVQSSAKVEEQPQEATKVEEQPRTDETVVQEPVQGQQVTEEPAQVQQSQEQPAPAPEQVQQETTQGDDQYIIAEVRAGTSPGTNIPYAKLAVVNSAGKKMLLIAKGQDMVDLVDQVPDNTPVQLQIEEENGFKFLKGVSLPEQVK